MPELPEVETIAADVRPHLEGARIRMARVFKPDILRGIRGRAFERALARRRVRSVGRRAKHVVILLDDGRRLVIQPRMTGALLVESGLRREARDPYDAFELVLNSGKRVRYRDVRRLGAVYLLSPPQWEAYEAAIGPEPLEPGFTARRLGEILARASTAVKKAIMDQRRLAGVGNIYANEALWLAGIDPSRAACALLPAEVRRLHTGIRNVLRRSIRGRGTTVRDYLTGTGTPGAFQRRLAVYGRDGQPCRRCRSRLAVTHAVDGRSTYFCHRCQR